MAHKIFDNKVMEDRIENAVITALDLNNYMTADHSLTESEGMTKEIHRYKGTGDVEAVTMGNGNTGDGIEVSFDTVSYTVGCVQGRFSWFDEQEMTDNMLVQTGLDKMAKVMVDDLTKKAIAEFNKATLTSTFDAAGMTFANVVDAIAKMKLEDESGLFLLVSVEDKAGIRKSLAEDLKYSEGFARTGYIGTVCGVPVIATKAVEAGTAFLATREAVTCFVKTGVETENEREANIRKNTFYSRKYAVVALTDENKVVKLTQAA